MQDLILDLRDLPDDLAALGLSGLMLFPDPSDNSEYNMWMVRQFLAFAADSHIKGLKTKLPPDENIKLNRQIGRDLGEMISVHGGWSALANATLLMDGFKKPLQSYTAERIRTGKIVGMVLNHAIAEKMGIQGAIKDVCGRVSSKEMDELLSQKGSKPVRQTPKTFENHTWRPWRPAAHLWAAYVIQRPMTVENPKRWLSLDQYPKGFDGFVKQAEEVLMAAGKQLPPRGPRKPILNPDICWKILR